MKLSSAERDPHGLESRKLRIPERVGAGHRRHGGRVAPADKKRKFLRRPRRELLRPRNFQIERVGQNERGRPVESVRRDQIPDPFFRLSLDPLVDEAGRTRGIALEIHFLQRGQKLPFQYLEERGAKGKPGCAEEPVGYMKGSVLAAALPRRGQRGIQLLEPVRQLGRVFGKVESRRHLVHRGAPRSGIGHRECGLDRVGRQTEIRILFLHGPEDPEPALIDGVRGRCSGGCGEGYHQEREKLQQGCFHSAMAAGFSAEVFGCVAA